MWLLSTSRAELKFFVSPKDVPGGYAILSHVWGSQEQSFQDMQALYTRCAKTGENPRDLAFEKVRRSCELAKRYGYEYLWNDTCCIDKTSSAELSEAINSMFNYYSLAAVCYAYLEDVSGAAGDSTAEQDAQLRSSRWHTRGWTLQELVAPRRVFFFSQAWDFLGSKDDFAPLLEEVTGIPASILRLEAALGDFNVAQRMSWAANRKTTRIEDEAYSLLGIFGINMPTLYGEGSRAFLRLQEEIMRRSADTTLFAWGAYCKCSLVANTYSYGQSVSRVFAPAPSAFGLSAGIQNVPLGRRWQQMSYPQPRVRRAHPGGTMSFSTTPYGVLAHIPLITIGDLVLGDLMWSTSDGKPLFLLLVPIPIYTSPPSYFVGRPLPPTSSPNSEFVRSVHDPPRISLKDFPLVYVRSRKWRTVYLQHEVRMPFTPHGNRMPYAFGPPAPERVVVRQWLSLADDGSPVSLDLDRVLPKPYIWSGSPPATFFLKSPLLDNSAGEIFVLQIGRCTERVSSHQLALKLLWARIQRITLPDSDSAQSRGEELRVHQEAHAGHSCRADHIMAWPDLSRTFSHSLARSTKFFDFTLSFTRYWESASVQPVMHLTLRVVHG